MNDLHFRKCTFAALAFLVAASILSVVPMMADGSEADVEYDEDIGSYWAMGVTVRYSFPGGDPPETVTYDFGDGSELKTVGPYDSVSHRYDRPGVYYIKQTVTNSAGQNFYTQKVELLGYPDVTFVIGNGQSDIVVSQTSYDSPVEVPEAPVVEGMRFAGWYADSDFSHRFDASAGIIEPVTVYAKYVDESAPVTYYVSLIDPSDGHELLAYNLESGDCISVADVTAALLKSGKIYAAIYADADLTSKYDASSPVMSDMTLYVMYTPAVPDLDDIDSWVIIGVAAVGIFVLIGGVAVGNLKIAVIGLVAGAIASLLHFGVIP